MEKTENKCQVHLIKTDKRSNIQFCSNDTLFYHPNGILSTKDCNAEIYITSDDEIKEGDYCIDGNELFGPYEKGDIAIESFKKIIATTDKLAIEPFQGFYEGKDCTNYLPQPSPQFIQKYIDEYNKGNVIKEVMVEYSYKGQQYNESDILNSFHPKINLKDNTINIRLIKDSWNKEELIQKLQELKSILELKHHIEMYDETSNGKPYSDDEEKQVNQYLTSLFEFDLQKWINNNI